MERARAYEHNPPRPVEKKDGDDFLIKARTKLEMIASQRKGKEIDMNQFRGLGEDYSDSIVDFDIDEIKRLEGEFAETARFRTGEAEILGKIFEQIVLENFGKWIAENVSVQEASRFDDLKNGVDAVAEIKRPAETNYLALALDATHGNNVTNKLARIRDQIKTGKMTEVKYYQSPDDSFRGKLLQVPRVVIGADKFKVMELAKLWVDGKEDELSAHPIQFQVLEEIILQLETFRGYALFCGKISVAETYKKQLDIFRKYQSEKIKTKGKPDTSYRSTDGSFLAIEASRKNFANLQKKK
ncbi:MAG: hypothetical protein NT093_02560 [Candidatus Moranbacteria bacterium]|nr:hypothetical protein [Candidatus Moranbacteria bacterium]